jgi:cation transport ATPase
MQMTPDTPSTDLTYSVPGVSCSHCRAAIVDEVSALNGVTAVEVDLEGKRVSVRGSTPTSSVWWPPRLGESSGTPSAA